MLCERRRQYEIFKIVTGDNELHVHVLLVMVRNPAHDMFSIGHFLCRVRVVDCCDLCNGAERQ